ncbi:hypothetical protein ALC56_00395, partial [Trachymyrmex septentrionalis]
FNCRHGLPSFPTSSNVVNSSFFPSRFTAAPFVSPFPDTLITSLSTGYRSIPVEHPVTHIRQDCFHPTKTARRAVKIDVLSPSPPLPLKPRDACACGNGDDAVGLDKGRWPT